MTMKVVILNASPRPSGVIARACTVAAETARKAGAETTAAELYRMTYAPCTGCMGCRTTGHCPLPHDAAHDLGEAIREADLLIVATPTYWGGMAARLKQLFERLVPLFMGLSRQVIFLIPSLYFFSHWFGLTGVWLSLPCADLLSAIVAIFLLRSERRIFYPRSVTRRA